MNKVLLNLLLVGWFAAVGAAAAGEPLLVVSPGTVADLVRSGNPDLVAARLRIAEASGRVTGAGRLSNPELEFEMRNDTAFRDGEASFELSQAFPLTKRLSLEKGVSRAELAVAEAEVGEVERRLVAAARSALVDVIVIREQRALRIDQAEVSKNLADFVSKVASRGEGSAIDAGQARLDAAQLASEVRQMDAEEVSVTGDLKRVLGVSPDRTLRIGGTLPAVDVKVRAGDGAERSDLVVAELEADVAAQTIELEESRRLEDLEVGLIGGVERISDAADEAVIGLRVTMPIPWWNRNEGAIEEANARHQRELKEIDALKAVIVNEITTARAEMAEWRALANEIGSDLLPLAGKQTAAAEQAYRNGQGDLQAVLRARKQLIQLAVTRLDAVRQYHQARVRALAALGK